MKGKMKASSLRALVAGLVIVIVAIGYFTRVGIGNLSGFGIDVFSLLCPLGYLESILASKVFVPRALISFLCIVLFVVILGRVFCSWICPMPFLQKLIPGFKRKESAKKAHAEEAAGSDTAMVEASENAEPGVASAKVASAVATGVGETLDVPDEPETADASRDHDAAKPNKFKFDSRYGVLLGALASAAIFGFPVFCLVCPVGLTFATVYLVLRLFVFGEVTWTVVLVPLILLLEVVFLRKWCSRICPLGALMSLISGANKTLRPSIDNGKCLQTSKGIACMKCAQVCGERINIRKPELSQTSLNNCTKCRECSTNCPAQAISFPLLPKKTEKEPEKAEKQ